MGIIKYSDFDQMRDAYMMFFIFMFGMLAFQISMINKLQSKHIELTLDNTDLIVKLRKVDEASLEAMQSVAKAVQRIDNEQCK